MTTLKLTMTNGLVFTIPGMPGTPEETRSDVSRAFEAGGAITWTDATSTAATIVNTAHVTHAQVLP